MIRRVITAVAGIPIVVCLALFAAFPVFVAAVMLVSILALHEYFALTKTHGTTPLVWIGHLIGAAIILSFCFSGSPLVVLLPSSSALILMAALFLRRDLKPALETTAATLFGPWYVCGLMGAVVSIRLIDAMGLPGGHLLLLLFVIIWANDIFAYAAGKTLGRHKLAPQVSPNKTVEGAVAGLVFGVIAAVIYAHFFLPDLAPSNAALLGTVVGFFGQIGDLCQSLLKRSANVKDSGNILPGHGGMLDRIDSLLFGAPALYYYSYYLLLHR